MEIARTVRQISELLIRPSRPMALVPTMGALHEGHLSLIEQARKSASTVVVSIFVNPKQFSPTEDLESYPRDLEFDLELLQKNGVDLVFCPDITDMYPDGFATSIQLEGPALPLEGKLRPGHFHGVSTVVAKLLILIAPDTAYFGQKDAQQISVIRRMVSDLNIPAQIVVCPTLREKDGLAMSSRNSYLSSSQRLASSIMYRALQETFLRYQSGERRRKVLENLCRRMLETEPSLDKIDYVEIVDPETFMNAESLLGDASATLVIAAYFGSARLIDNCVLNT
tara:strand:- start:346 stop:1191 length:846 start_codon:yes stop_codon:yes gene_type:complete